MVGAVDKGKQIHDEIFSQGLLEKDVVLGNSLISMYAKCGVLTKAQQYLNELSVRDTLSWSVLIAGYAQNQQGDKALICFQQMQSEGFSPDAFTYTSLLKACGSTRPVDRGKQIHDEIVSQGLLRKEVVLGHALVDMYAKCGALAKAQEVLNKLPVRDVVAWSALITGYVQKRLGEEALKCFQQMRSEGVSPNSITYACSLKACGITRAIDTGREIHDEIVNQGLLEKDVMLGTALVDMYAKCGVLSKAQQVLEELHFRNISSWNALLTGYAQLGQCREVLDCFQHMQREGLAPDAITYVCILKACGITGAFDVGKKAQQIVDALPVRDVICWSSLLAGYTQHGQCEEALECFQQMQSEGVTPNIVSWNALIGSYAQQGHAEEAV